MDKHMVLGLGHSVLQTQFMLKPYMLHGYLK